MRWSGPASIVAAPCSQWIACSPAQNGRRARPLNSVVRRHLSERKGIVRMAEILAACLALVNLSSAISVHFRWVSAESVASLIAVSFFLMFLVFLVAVLLATELAKVTHDGESWRERSRGLSTSDLRSLTRWCPRWLLFLCILGIVVSLLIVIPIGGVHWTEGQPFTSKEALGFGAGLSLFCLLAVPVLASASRMPGSFESQFTNDA